MTEELETIDPQERFQELFKTEKYRQRISQMAVAGKTSLIVDFEDILTFDHRLAEELLEKPDEYLKHANNAAYAQLQTEDPEYAEKIADKQETVTLRVVRLLEVAPLRKLGSDHIGKLVMVEGIVVRSTPVRPMVMQATFKCKRCGEITPINQTGQFLRAPFVCKNPACNAKGFFEFIQEESTFIDSQDLRLQERPEDLPPGQLPRTLHVKLVGSEIVDVARPGDHISAVGIVRALSPTLPRVGKLRTFTLHLDTNSIEVLGKEPEIAQPSPEEEKKILELSKDPWIHRKIMNSIAPSIYGYDHIKESIMYLLFGGVPKSLPDITIRGEMNALLIGDPGTAKSQLLQYVARVAPRGLYTSGRGTTAAGLTAAVIRERGGGMSLEAGALVLADKGIACIDEMDKMRPEDRVAIHEAMEQHSYHPSFEIMLADGRKMLIGDFVDSLFEKYGDRMIIGNDCQVLPITDLNIRLESTYDFLSFKHVLASRVSRHKAPDKFIKIRYSNGREILVTPEHPIFVFRKGKITPVAGKNVSVKDFVPAVDRLELDHSNKIIEPPCKLHWNEKAIRAPPVLNEGMGGTLGYLISEGYSCKGSSTEVGFSNTNPLYIKEMNALMSEMFSIQPINYSEVNRTQRYVSAALYRFLNTNFPSIMKTASEKRVPPSVLAAENNVVSNFLRTCFKGDGSLESETVCFRTISKGLAEDYQDLLLTLGLHSRIVADRSNNSYKVYIAGDSLPTFFKNIVCTDDPRYHRIRKLAERSMGMLRHHNVLPTDFAHVLIHIHKLLGLPYDGYFHEHLRQGCGITKEVASKTLDKLENRLSYLKKALNVANEIRYLRKALGWSQNKAAKVIGETRNTICYAENGGYDFLRRKTMLEKLLQAAEGALADAEKQIRDVRRTLESEVRWLRVTDVKEVDNAGDLATQWVYDVTVEPTHNFVNHGLILHNTVSVAKGGIVATLNARTAILAAANPALGRYEPHRTVAENISLPVTILSRFDLIFVLRDVPNKEADDKMSEHILEMHRKGLSPVEPPMPSDMLRKYISYAKGIKPVLTQEALQRLRDFYLAMRSASESEGSPVAITARQLESLVRISEARARASLRKEVLTEDAEAAITIMKRSLEEVGIDMSSYKIDIDLIMTGKPKSVRDKMQTVLSTLMEMEKETGIVEKTALLNELETKYTIPIGEAERLIAQLLREGTIYEPRESYLKKT